MKRMHDDKELIKLLQDEGFLNEVKVENVDSDNATQGEVLMADGSGGAEWSQVEAGMENPMTAKDDLIIGGAAGAPARLAKGTNGQVLAVGSDGLEWATPSGGGSVIEVLQAEYYTGNYAGGSVTNTMTEASYNTFKSASPNTLFLLNFYDRAGSSMIMLIRKHNDTIFYAINSPIFKKNATDTRWYGTAQSYYIVDLTEYISITEANRRFAIQWSGHSFNVPTLTDSNFNALYAQKNAPDTDGTYILKCTVVSGVKTYTWVAE